jgi:hypothetical protein
MVFQEYSSIQTPKREYTRNANDYFWTLSAAFPFRRYRAEFEFTAAHTHHQHLGFDNFRISYAYSLLDDREDPFSLMVGMILGEPYSRALHDVSSFHHGHLESEFFLTMGGRIGPCYNKDYTFRYWNVVGLGCSDRGSSWIREDAAIEFKVEMHEFRVFANTLWGLGHDNLKLNCFKGYGRIQHRSVDVGFRYGCSFDCFGTLSVQYARRVYAHNFPQQANLVMFEYYLPFGSQDPPYD